jgi:hypothetical protein
LVAKAVSLSIVIDVPIIPGMITSLFVLFVASPGALGLGPGRCRPL